MGAHKSINTCASIIRDNLSMQSIKIQGDLPCRIPLVGLKNGKTFPLTRMDIAKVLMHDMIRLTNLSGNLK